MWWGCLVKPVWWGCYFTTTSSKTYPAVWLKDTQTHIKCFDRTHHHVTCVCVCVCVTLYMGVGLQCERSWDAFSSDDFVFVFFSFKVLELNKKMDDLDRTVLSWAVLVTIISEGAEFSSNSLFFMFLKKEKEIYFSCCNISSPSSCLWSFI